VFSSTLSDREALLWKNAGLLATNRVGLQNEGYRNQIKLCTRLYNPHNVSKSANKISHVCTKR